MIFNRLAKTTSFVSHLLFTRTLYQINIPLRSPSLPTQRSSLIQPFTIGCLYNNYGSRRYPKQVGRGPGSGKGKFAGRGMKGQKARSGGGVHVRFQGGQTPLQRRLPKYGQVYQKKGRQILTYVNIKDIDYFVSKGIINKDQKITIKTLHDVGLAKKIKYGVKILGKGSERINYPLHIEVSDASKTVIQAVQAAGGSVELIYRTPLKLNEHIFPQKYPLPLKDPITAAWKLRKLERLSENRGIQVKYTKPQWKLEEQKQMKQLEESEQQKNKTTFVYPVPRVPNPDKIRTRRVKLYKKISYNL